MSYVNPLSILEVCCFLNEYEKQLLDMMNGDIYSLRYHTRNDKLYYKSSNKSLVEYQYIKTNDKTSRIEASGNYYNIVPYKRLDLFYKSELWFDLNRQYKFFGKIDFNKCFDSIYTHTYNWAIAGNIVEAKSFNKNHILSTIDRLLQNMNMSVTNGIIVGPEFSRMLAEILLQNIDNEIFIELNKLNLNKDIDYTIKRFLDDIFIFSNSEENINKIISVIARVSEEYKLYLNNTKKEIGKLPHIWFNWRESVNRFTVSMSHFLFHEITDEEHTYILKEQNLKRNNKFAKIKELFQDVVIRNKDYNVKVVSYCLSTIFNKLSHRNFNEINKTIFNKGKDKVIYRLYDLVFYIYSFAATYNNTEKLISIIFIIEKEIGHIQSKTILNEIAIRYEFIINNGNIEDIVNLLLMYKCNDIKLKVDTEEILENKIVKNDNPMLYAVYLKYLCGEKLTTISIVVEKKIDKAISEIKNNNKIFLYNQIWWILIFYGCPCLSDDIQDKMNKKIKLILNKREKSQDVCNVSKQVVCKFILDSNYKMKFINWNLEKGEFYEEIIFKTFERTIFNGKENIGDDYYYEY
ncbi:RNA-directed DNA polymerase [Clostridium butyricum]